MSRTRPAAPELRREPLKCDPERQQWCWALRESFRPPYSEGLGLTRAVGWVDTDSPGARPRFQGIILRGAPRARGIFINYCPFCGAKMALPAKSTIKGEASGDHSG